MTGVAAVIFGVGSLVVDNAASSLGALTSVVVAAAGVVFVVIVEMSRALASDA